MTVSRRIMILNERDPAHPRAGGAEIHVSEIFSRLVERGHSVHQYSAGFSGGASMDTLSGVHIERAAPVPRYYAGVPGRILRARRENEFDLIVECLNKVPFYSPLFAGGPVLALCHHLFGEVAFSQVPLPLAAMVWLSERGLPLSYRRTPFLAISESSRDDLVARGLSAERVAVSHPGINPPALAVDASRPRPCRITYLGRLEAYKRVDMLFYAAARLVERFPDLELCVIGRGPERADLEKLAARLGLAAKTRFTGFVSDEKRDALLADSRACIFPSEKEGWGLTVIEANALGVPVVASDSPGLRDSVKHEETGLLVAPNDVAAFVTGLSRLLEDSPQALSMRAAALSWSKGFDWDRAATDMEAAIEKSIGDFSP